MPWPSGGDYRRAFQNPQYAFLDPVLRDGVVRTDRHNLPIVLSGSFAAVARVDSGDKSYAVRCFTTEVTDQQERYQALSQCFASIRLPVLVGFQYLAAGILLRGARYPVVRMEWAEGRLLDTYVQAALGDQECLRRLADEWRRVVAMVRARGVAHGDLQPGNVVVSDSGKICLVDYDGFYVPALQGRPSGEVGQPNCQHPARGRDDYGDYLDAFPALVIYLSILALSKDPDLWEFNNGQNLILSAEDFQDPGRTPVWDRLAHSPDPLVRTLTLRLDGACRLPVAAVPTLDELLGQEEESEVVILCPRCGHRNPPAEIYCQAPGCAHQLTGNRRCPFCARSVPARAAHCPQCGGDLRSLPQKADAGGAR